MAALERSEVCVLIPAHNEEKSIGRIVGEVRGLGYAVVVSDDGSSDQTAAVSRSAGAAVLSANRNRGKGSSLRRGFQWFLWQPYKALVLMDADGQHDPKDLGFFLQALNLPDGDFIVGNRMASPRRMPFLRVVTNRLMSKVLSRLAGQSVPDSQCGYRALRREVIEKIALKTSRFEIESEMILEASRAGFKIHSIPIVSFYEEGSSHIQPVSDTFRFFKFLLNYLAKK